MDVEEILGFTLGEIKHKISLHDIYLKELLSGDISKQGIVVLLRSDLQEVFHKAIDFIDSTPEGVMCTPDDCTKTDDINDLSAMEDRMLELEKQLAEKNTVIESLRS